MFKVADICQVAIALPVVLIDGYSNGHLKDACGG